jgi:hypothetical protein
MLKMAVATAAFGMTDVACGPVAVAPSPAAARSAVLSSAAVSSSPGSNSSQHAERLTVSGTEVDGSPLGLSVELPPDWQSFGYGASRGTSIPPAGMAFVVSVVDNTFEDPCTHRQRSPKVGSTVTDLAAALGRIPDTSATNPVQTTIAGHEATYIEIAIPASLPCVPSEFYFWQDSPDGYWWVQGLNETARIWILEVAGERVTFLAHSYPGSGDNAKAEFQKILDSVVFDGAS